MAADRHLAVTGLGAVTPAGLGVDALWAAVRAGRVCTGPIERVDTAGFPHRVGGTVPADALAGLDALVPAHPSLAARYLAAAVAEALAAAGPAPGAVTGLFVGTVMGTRPVLDQAWGGSLPAAARRVWDDPLTLLELVDEVAAIDGPRVLAAPGCAAGNSAIELGARAVASGEVDRAVCAGTEQLSVEVLSLFTSLRALTGDLVRPFDLHRTGMAPGEGAAVVVLERPGATPARPLARLLATASGADAYHLTQPHPAGHALRATLDEVLARSGTAPEQVDWLCAHGTGTPANDALEARVVGEALGAVPVSSLKGLFGHSQGAAALVEAVVSVRALAEGFLPGTATLSTPDPGCGAVELVAGPGRDAELRVVASPAFGFGGSVSTVLLGAA